MSKNFKDALLERLDTAADRMAYSFTDERGQREEVTYAQLLCRAIAIGEAIGAHAGPGDRVMLMVSPGIDYVAGFLACWIDGFISVPAYPLRKNQRASRTESIIADAAPAVVLLNRRGDLFADLMQEQAVSPRPVFLSDIAAGTTCSDPRGHIVERMSGQSDDLVFLQYTSGSTGNPKGTMVSHGNLAHNSAQMQRKLRTESASVMVSWLPPYHDMGLIFGVLQPLFVGFPCHLMAPAAFMQRPLQWLQMIAQTRATISGGPNFAYDLCVKRAADLAGPPLDLSAWQVAFNGAEPIMPDTLRQFVQAFAPHGFHARALHPCYGLAENTLMVSGQDDVPDDADSLACHIVALQEDGAAADAKKEVVSSGTSIAGQDVAIVDPATGTVCPDGTIGEVWVSGESVAQGYWNNPAETAATFHATLAAHADGKRYLRTGDLGQMHDGKLAIRGRLKDIIIIRGMKFYPQDIERAVEAAYPQIRHGGYCAVFQSDELQPGSVAVVAEIAREHRKQDHSRMAETIRAAIVNEFGFRVSRVSLVQPGCFPKTSSGKIPRNVIKTDLLKNESSIT